MDTNVRPETMARITTPELAKQFIVIAALAMPLYRYAFALCEHLPQKAQAALRFLSALLLFVAFLLTIEYLLPQFPQYVELAYRRLLS